MEAPGGARDRRRGFNSSTAAYLSDELDIQTSGLDDDRLSCRDIVTPSIPENDEFIPKATSGQKVAASQIINDLKKRWSGPEPKPTDTEAKVDDRRDPVPGCKVPHF